MKLKHNRILSLILTLFMLMSLLPAPSVIAESATAYGVAFSGGDGTEQNPYQISSADQFVAFSKGGDDAASLWKSHFILTNDIDLSGQTVAPIGVASSYAISTYFTGGFDGGNHTISNLTIENSGYASGLFMGVKTANRSQSAFVKNLTLKKATITGLKQVGALIGYNCGGTITNCRVLDSTVSGWAAVGGLIGKNYYGGTYGDYIMGTLHASSYEGRVTKIDSGSGTSQDFGGLVGYDNGSGDHNTTITECYADATVIGGNYTGGLTGESYASAASDCYVKGSVTGDNTVGGISGRLKGSYSASASLSNSYSTATVNGTSEVGGIVGAFDSDKATVSMLYYNNEISLAPSHVFGSGSTTQTNVLGVDSSFLSTLADTLNADRDPSIWRAAANSSENNGYPCLTVLQIESSTKPVLASPANLSWKQNTVSWDRVDHAVKYEIQLYQGDAKAGSSVFTQDTFYDMTALLLAHDSGDYTFTVTALGDSEYQNSVPSAQSPVYAYTAPQKLTTPTPLTWQGNTATWSASSYADSYLVSLYKNGTLQGNAVSTTDLSYDFTDAMVESASYTFAVTAIGSGSYQNSSLSEQSVENRYISDSDYVAISSADELIELANITGENEQKEAYSKNYRLTQDIVMTAKTTQKIMKSIGNSTVPFSGVFDGNGKSIENLGLDATDGGLFYKIDTTSVVKNLTVKSAVIASNGSSGIFAKTNNGTITDCCVIDSKLSSQNGANLAGFVYENNEGGVLSRSYVSGGDVSTDYNPSYATGMAGFVGNNRGTITECYATMEVKGANAKWCGGFVGQAISGTISDCYAVGNVTGREKSGGFAGRLGENASFLNCYANNNVSGSGNSINPFIGELQYSGGTTTNCYYNSDNTFPKTAAVLKTETAKTKEELKQISLGSKWIVDSEGKINEGLPYLKNLPRPSAVNKAKTITIGVTIVDYNENTYTFSPRKTIQSLQVTAVNPTIYNALEAAEKTIPFHATYSKEFGYYVDSIDNVSLSDPNGWMFMVNDAISSLGVSSQSIKNGDHILWYPGMPSNLFTGPTWESMQTDYVPPVGEGTVQNPYQISSANQLSHIMDHPDASYQLANDIDLSGIDWTPLGNMEIPFSGNLDGNSHTISHLTISQNESSQNVGLFGVIFGAKLTNITLKDVNVTGGTQVGALVGYAKEATNENGKNAACILGNCHVKGGRVTGLSQINSSATTRVGGLVGFNDGNNVRPDTGYNSYSYCSIDQSSANVTVQGTHASSGSIGGLVGYNRGMITACHAVGNVSGSNTIGGLVGSNAESIYDSYATGHVSGKTTVGGFVGMSQGSIQNCFSKGNVIAADITAINLGGFAGSITGVKTKNCVSTGTLLNGQSNHGGFVGNFSGNLNTAGGALTANLIDCFGNCESASGTTLKGIGSYISSGNTATDEAANAVGVSSATSLQKLETLCDTLSLTNIEENDGTAGYLLAKSEALKYHSAVNIPIDVAANSDITNTIVALRNGKTADNDILLVGAQTKYNGYVAYQPQSGHFLLYKNSDNVQTETVSLLFISQGEIYKKDITVLVGENTAPQDGILEDGANWPLFRGSGNNMAILSDKTPRSNQETELLWQNKLSTDSWGTASSPILSGGYLYTVSTNGLEKVDLQTGLVLKTAPIADGIDYTPHIAAGGGQIYVPLKNGSVQAFDAETMDSLWVSAPTASGDQLTGPLYYADGYLYTGTYSYRNGGTYFCLNTIDENAQNSSEIKKPVWTYQTEGNAYYWAGAVVTGNAVIFGSEKGVLTSLNKQTGDVLDTYTATAAIRSSISFAYNNAYFTSKDGNIYCVPVKEDGTFYHDSILTSAIADGATSSTSTPLVSGGRIYVGGATKTGGVVGVLNSYTFKPIYHAETAGNVQSSPLLTTAYQKDTQKVYIYVTSNTTPGGIQVLEDDADNTTAQIRDLFIPESDKQNYCAASIIGDYNGHLYYKNDSGYFFKLGVKEAIGAKVSFSTVPSFAAISLTDKDGATVTATSNHNYDLAAGTYTATVSANGYTTKTKTITVTKEAASSHTETAYAISLSRESNTGGGTTTSRILVKFALLGDSVHGASGVHTSTQTWIDPSAFYLPEGSTAYDVFNQALTSNGFSFVEKSYNYISSITTPSSLGNLTLAEGLNGSNSGWMYTVNGEYPNYGMREQSLKSGDKIVFYYTDDYTKEPPSISWNTNTNTSGNVSNSDAPTVSQPKVTLNEGGVVSPMDLSNKLGQSVSFNITPKQGYQIKDVLVDGKSVGAVSSYTYPSVKATTTLQVIFEKAEENSAADETSFFKDVSNLHWAKDAIYTLASQKIISGKTAALFYPEDLVTRAEFVSMLARMSGETLEDTSPVFSDIQKDAWYAASVAWASKAGIVSGITAATFSPNDTITREQMAAMVMRYSTYQHKELLETTESAPFTDESSISRYAIEAVQSMQKSGILHGNEQGEFSPQKKATRAEAAQVLYQFENQIKK